jgi:hypothetical protein
MRPWIEKKKKGFENMNAFDLLTYEASKKKNLTPAATTLRSWQRKSHRQARTQRVAEVGDAHGPRLGASPALDEHNTHRSGGVGGRSVAYSILD